jgi:hypothetical protein
MNIMMIQRRGNSTDDEVHHSVGRSAIFPSIL